MKVKFTSTVPTKPGKYLTKSSNGIDIATVILYPATIINGVTFEEYLGVSELGGRDIRFLDRYYKFSEEIEEEF